jgi:hypothetical protein
MLAYLPAHPATLDVVWRMALSGTRFWPVSVALTIANDRGGSSDMLGPARLLGQTIVAARWRCCWRAIRWGYAGSPSGRCRCRNVWCGAQHAPAVADRCAWRQA